MPGFERTEHPHIVRVPGIGGGEPIIENTRISVRLIATYYKAGDTAEDILRDYPQLSLATIHDAISYYLDHPDKIETLIEAHKIETVLAREGLRMNEAGIIYHPDDKSQPGAKQLDFFSARQNTDDTYCNLCQSVFNCVLFDYHLNLNPPAKSALPALPARQSPWLRRPGPEAG